AGVGAAVGTTVGAGVAAVRAGLGGVHGDGRAGDGAQRGVLRIGQAHRERPGHGGRGVEQRDGDGLVGGVAVRPAQGAGGGRVINSGQGGAVQGSIVHRGRAGAATGAADGQRRRRSSV